MLNTQRVCCTESATFGAQIEQVYRTETHREEFESGYQAQRQRIAFIIPTVSYSHETISMSVIGEFTVPASALAMQQTLDEVPEMSVQIERVVAHESGILTPYFWVRGGDMERFKSALEDDPSVLEYTRVDMLEKETLYRAVWPTDVESIAQAYLEAGATVLEATGRNQRWELRLRFDNQPNLSAFNEYCEENNIPLTVNRIYNPTTVKGGGQFGITPKQREALVAALDAGFYEIPPAATMTEIAEALGISQQALSKRLRRAHGNIVSNVLTIEELNSRD